MNLVELYRQTSVERHQNIRVLGDRVFVKNADGSSDEYLITDSGMEEALWLIRSDKELRQDVKAMKSKLGITEVNP